MALFLPPCRATRVQLAAVGTMEELLESFRQEIEWETGLPPGVLI